MPTKLKKRSEVTPAVTKKIQRNSHDVGIFLRVSLACFCGIFKEKCQKYDRPKCTEDDVLVRVRRRRHSLLTSDTDQFNLLPANIGVQA